MELKYKDRAVEQILDASGRTVMPGLVDAHTHPVWAGDRVHEFAMKVLQKKYILGDCYFNLQPTIRGIESFFYFY